MRQETFTLSAKELQRVAVISSCSKGDLACAGAAELLDLSPRQVKRLKSRYQPPRRSTGPYRRRNPEDNNER